MGCFVFVVSNKHDLVKISHSSDIKKRVSQMEAEERCDLSVIYYKEVLEDLANDIVRISRSLLRNYKIAESSWYDASFALVKEAINQVRADIRRLDDPGLIIGRRGLGIDQPGGRLGIRREVVRPVRKGVMRMPRGATWEERARFGWIRERMRSGLADRAEMRLLRAERRGMMVVIKGRRR